MILISTGKHQKAIVFFVLKALVKRIRKVSPGTGLLFRGDTGFYTPRLMNLCKSMMIDYIVGYSVNAGLKKYDSIIELQAAALDAKVETLAQGENLRFVLMSLNDETVSLYNDIVISAECQGRRLSSKKAIQCN